MKGLRLGLLLIIILEYFFLFCYFILQSLILGLINNLIFFILSMIYNLVLFGSVGVGNISFVSKILLNDY